MDTLRNLILELYRAARETPVDEFQELALALVKVQTPFRTAVWGTGEMTEAGLVIHSVHLHNEPPEMLTDWTSINHHDTVIGAVVANPGRALILHTPSWYNTPDLGFMLDYTRRYGHLNSMVITTVDRNHPHGQWLSLYRPGKHDHFGQADQHILEQIMPHLVEALAINHVLGLGYSPCSGVAGTRALARMDGTLYHCGKRFAELLRESWPEWKSARLPAELVMALHPGKEIMLAGHAIAVSASAIGNMLLLNIRRVSPLCRLSRRELEVARLYGQGKSHKEIGLLLDISPATVRNFLGRVYTKLDIGDKAELARLLVESTNLP